MKKKIDIECKGLVVFKYSKVVHSFDVGTNQFFIKIKERNIEVIE